MDNKVSPLKAKPLRQAGQSVQRQIIDLIFDKGIFYIIGSVVLVIFAASEWVRYIFHTPPSPYGITVAAVLFSIYSAYKIRQTSLEIRRLKQGMDGEKAVGEFLERLREDGASVFHDVVGDNFNIDHVVLSSKGIFAIETKTYSKYEKGNTKVRYENGNLYLDGIGNKNKILVQVKAESTWLQNMLRESTGKRYEITPVILFPGWWVEPNNEEIMVLEPKQLLGKLKAMPDKLADEDKKLAAYHLSRYIRTM